MLSHWREPSSKALRESVQIMDPDEEYITIASAEEQMSATAAARKKELDAARSNMKGMRHISCHDGPCDLLPAGS